MASSPNSLMASSSRTEMQAHDGFYPDTESADKNIPSPLATVNRPLLVVEHPNTSRLLRLPTEIHHEIAKYCSVSELAFLAKLHRISFDIYNPVLYKRAVQEEDPRLTMHTAATGNLAMLKVAVKCGADIRKMHPVKTPKLITEWTFKTTGRTLSSLGTACGCHDWVHGRPCEHNLPPPPECEWVVPDEPILRLRRPDMWRPAQAVNHDSPELPLFWATPLHVAAHNGHLETVEWLIWHGASPKSYARMFCDCQALQLCNITERGVFPNCAGASRFPAMTPLHYAICGRHLTVALALLRHNRDMHEDLSFAPGLRAHVLALTRENGSRPLLDELNSYGDQFNEWLITGEDHRRSFGNAIHTATRSGLGPVVSYLARAYKHEGLVDDFAYSFDLPHTRRRGLTPMTYAVALGNDAMVRLLISLGASKYPSDQFEDINCALTMRKVPLAIDMILRWRDLWEIEDSMEYFLLDIIRPQNVGIIRNKAAYDKSCQQQMEDRREVILAIWEAISVGYVDDDFDLQFIRPVDPLSRPWGMYNERKARKSLRHYVFLAACNMLGPWSSGVIGKMLSGNGAWAPLGLVTDFQRRGEVEGARTSLMERIQLGTAALQDVFFSMFGRGVDYGFLSEFAREPYAYEPQASSPELTLEGMRTCRLLLEHGANPLDDGRDGFEDVWDLETYKRDNEDYDWILPFRPVDAPADQTLPFLLRLVDAVTQPWAAEVDEATDEEAACLARTLADKGGWESPKAPHGVASGVARKLRGLLGLPGDSPCCGGSVCPSCAGSLQTKRSRVWLDVLRRYRGEAAE